jgi:hypothetical protein
MQKALSEWIQLAERFEDAEEKSRFSELIDAKRAAFRELESNAQFDIAFSGLKRRLAQCPQIEITRASAAGRLRTFKFP